MLRCVIELVPYGDVTQKERLVTLTIGNDRTGTLELGNYNATLQERDKVYKGRIENFPRLQHGPAFLVARAIEACLKEEEK